MSSAVIIRGIEQGSSEWHHLRGTIPTVSQFAKVMSPIELRQSGQRTGYAAKLAAARCGCFDPEFESHWTREGTKNEPKTIAAYELMTDSVVEHVAFVYRDESRTSGGSPDGLVGEEGGIEGKYPKASTHLICRKEQKVPSQYVGQVFGSLWVTGREWWDFISYYEGLEPVIVRTYRDDKRYLRWERAFEPQLESFLRLVHDLTPPEFQASTFEDDLRKAVASFGSAARDVEAAKKDEPTILPFGSSKAGKLAEKIQSRAAKPKPEKPKPEKPKKAAEKPKPKVVL